MRRDRMAERLGALCRGAALAAAMTAAGAGPAPAGGPAPDSPIGKLYLSRLLIAHAQATNDPLALVTAARIRAELGGSPDFGALKAVGDDPFAPEWLLDQAAAMAAPGDPLSALIEQTRKDLRRGGGAVGLTFEAPRREVRRIGPRSTDAIPDIAFPGNTFVEVYVEGDGLANLDLFVRAPSGVILCSDTDPSSINFCGWHNGAAQTLTIEIRNLDTVASQYRLFVQ